MKPTYWYSLQCFEELNINTFEKQYEYFQKTVTCTKILQFKHLNDTNFDKIFSCYFKITCDTLTNH